MTRSVTVQDMLRARDERAARQAEFLRRYGTALISFTMNIAGSIKTDAQIQRAFCEGEAWINAHLTQQHIDVLAHERQIACTGCEALWAVKTDAASLKRKMTAIEESCPLGRLFDVDVIDAQGQHLSRGTERACLICGGPVRACARSRTHSAEALFTKAQEIIRDHFEYKFAREISQSALRALLYEALTTPKPGLVDCRNSGAHQDMDLFSFADSISVLGGYFESCVQLGQQGKPLEQLQHAGILAEKSMLETAGVNTHKGAIFSLGILCYAVGRVGEDATQAALLLEAAQIGQFYLRQMITSPKSITGGEQQYQRLGLTGARGEAAAGFPSVLEIALPVLAAALQKGASVQDAGKEALLNLMARVKDSNVIRRAGMEGQTWLMAQAAHLLQQGYTDDALRAMDDEMIQRNISPGGSADLLAVAWFLHFVAQRQPNSDREEGIDG